MKLVTHRYSVHICSVLVPRELCNAPEINKDVRILRIAASDEYARLKDGISVPYDNLLELSESDDFNDLSVDFKSFIKEVLSDEFKQVDKFIFHV